MVKAMDATVECACKHQPRSLEDSAIDCARIIENLDACAKTIVPDLPAHGETFQSILTTKVRVRNDNKSLHRQATNEHEGRVILVATNGLSPHITGTHSL